MDLMRFHDMAALAAVLRYALHTAAVGAECARMRGDREQAARLISLAYTSLDLLSQAGALP